MYYQEPDDADGNLLLLIDEDMSIIFEVSANMDKDSIFNIVGGIVLRK